MANSKDLESPFKPQREKHALIYCKKFKAINDIRLVSNHDKGILLAVLAFTANEKLFKMFDRLSVSHLKELAHLSEIALKNLRNFDGRPVTTVVTPQVLTPTGSRSQSPLRGVTGREWSRHTGLPEIEGNTALDMMKISKPCDNPLGLGILASLGLKETFPGIPSKSFSISGATMEDDCILRQQDCCLFSGLGLAGEERTAHLFPPSSLDPTNAATILTWRFLHIFLGTANTKILSGEIWSKEKGIQTTKNGISVFSNEYGYFNRGEVALIPVRLTHAVQGSYDYLDVQVGLYSAGETVQRIKSFDKLAVEEQYIFRRGEAPERIFEDPGRYIKDGDMIRITTPDPELLPLPSYILMYWRRHLWSTITSAGLSNPPYEIAGEDSRDCYLRKHMSAQPLRINSSDGHHGYEEGGRDGYLVKYTDEDLQRIIDQEARFLDFLHEIAVREDDF
ncbi:hypothetical protein TWF970_009679 [Orbilia oligospora]|uniref:HNH nuclease domain-containing protein n=1 Tax=Orbilia oligospora TaxID=2813651 RepID=A0A7C8RH46_ORBOL|nr:hypothetical protein TWF970_009679 [Orbilia oligospora]